MTEEEGGHEDTRDDTSAMSALKGMISFFTIWHMDITQREMDSMETRFHLVPVVGLLLGAAVLVVLAIFGYIGLETGFGSSFFYAVLALATVYIGSKFLHFDGLTDFGDGMIVSGQREDHVRALKDTLVGAGGIGVALIVVLLSVSAYSTVGLASLIVLAPVAEIMVKNAQVVGAAFGEPGNGMAGRQVAMTTRDSIVKGVIVSAVAGFVMYFISMWVLDLVFGIRIVGFTDFIVTVFAVLLSGIVGSMLVGYAMARTANKNFGMVNGDILGATNEIARPVVMFLMFIAMTLVI